MALFHGLIFANFDPGAAPPAPTLGKNGDQAVGRCKLFEPFFKERTALWMGGSYCNDFARRNGEWRIKHLRLSIDFRTAAAEGWVRRRFADLDG